MCIRDSIVIMNQFKVPTFMGALMHDFGTDPGTTGWLMSVSYTHLDVYKRQP